jgi:hypothetical protein
MQIKDSSERHEDQLILDNGLLQLIIEELCNRDRKMMCTVLPPINNITRIAFANSE